MAHARPRPGPCAVECEKARRLPSAAASTKPPESHQPGSLSAALLGQRRPRRVVGNFIGQGWSAVTTGTRRSGKNQQQVGHCRTSCTAAAFGILRRHCCPSGRDCHGASSRGSTRVIPPLALACDRRRLPTTAVPGVLSGRAIVASFGNDASSVLARGRLARHLPDRPLCLSDQFY